MNDSIEYAKMIEIPTSSCEYTFKRKRRFFKKKKILKSINEELKRDGESLSSNEFFNGKTDGENVDNDANATLSNNNLPALYDEKQSKKDRKLSAVISAQVALLFALVSAIILTNVFWENSGMNTLFKSVFGSEKYLVDERAYDDFSLNLPISSPNGVNIIDGAIIIEGEYSLYPVCDGKISKVERAADGTFTVTVKHSESFSSISEGLEMVYFSSGEEISQNFPLGYVKKNAKVQLYNGDSLLTDYASKENSIVFNQ